MPLLTGVVFHHVGGVSQGLMSLIIRIDVDRPYGRRPAFRHFLSRLSSDLYFPKVAGLGFLTELQTMLTWLNAARARAYVFFRRCTLPSRSILNLLDVGRHEIGLHLENSRSLTTFLEETQIVERHVEKSAGYIQAWLRWREVWISSLCPLRTREVCRVGSAGFHAVVPRQSARPNS